MEDGKKTTDIFGLAPYGEALKIVTEKSIDGVGEFLGRICLPVAEEFGLMARDRIKAWRLNNAVAVCEKSQGKFQFSDNQLQLSAHPRVVQEILDKGSLQDDAEVQEMWAGLLTSAIGDGKDDSNLTYINILNGLTRDQAKLLNFLCEDALTKVTKNGLIYVEEKEYQIDLFANIFGDRDINELDKDFKLLRSLNLIVSSVVSSINFGSGNFYLDDDGDAKISIAVTTLALHMYVRCKGFGVQLNEFLKLEYTPDAPSEISDDSFMDAFHKALTN